VAVVPNSSRETTRIADAFDVGMPVALWLPFGSTSLLAELKVARQKLANLSHPWPRRTGRDDHYPCGGDRRLG